MHGGRGAGGTGRGMNWCIHTYVALINECLHIIRLEYGIGFERTISRVGLSSR